MFPDHPFRISRSDRIPNLVASVPQAAGAGARRCTPQSLTSGRYERNILDIDTIGAVGRYECSSWHCYYIVTRSYERNKGQFGVILVYVCPLTRGIQLGECPAIPPTRAFFFSSVSFF